MPELITKLSILRGFMSRGDWVSAMRLANSFGRLGEQTEAIRRAWSAHQNPQIYRDMGRDPDALWTAGIAALRERYGD